MVRRPNVLRRGNSGEDQLWGVDGRGKGWWQGVGVTDDGKCVKGVVCVGRAARMASAFACCRVVASE